METKVNNQVRFEVIRYETKDITTKSLSRTETEAIGLKSFDCCFAKCLDTEGYKDRKGQWHDFKDQNKGIGPDVGLKILQAIQLNPGIGLDKKTLAAITGLAHLTRDGILAARIHALRKAFGESKKSEHFIQTSDNGSLTLMWPKELTWIWVVPLLP